MIRCLDYWSEGSSGANACGDTIGCCGELEEKPVDSSGAGSVKGACCSSSVEVSGVGFARGPGFSIGESSDGGPLPVPSSSAEIL